MVAKQLDEYLPQPPARIADVGGGAGHQAIPLARKGYEVTILDPSGTMLREARRILTSEEESVRRRVRLVEGSGERAHEILDEGWFEVVLCHGVLPYIEDSYPLIQALASVACTGAVVSVLTKKPPRWPCAPLSKGVTGKPVGEPPTSIWLA